MGEYTHGRLLIHKVYESMGDLWLSPKEMLLLSRRTREDVNKAIRTGVQKGWMWSRQRTPGVVEYQVKREVRDSIRRHLSSRIDLTGKNTRRRKTHADASI